MTNKIQEKVLKELFKNRRYGKDRKYNSVIHETISLTLAEVEKIIDELRSKYNKGFTNPDLEELKQKLKGEGK